MASPQAEDGHLKIADSLVVAICRAEFSAVQMRILLAVMNMTYRVGKTKASISADDLRYATGVKAYKIQKATGELVDRKVLFVQHIPTGGRLVGIQKDYEQWLPKMGSANTSLLLDINNNPPVRALPKMGNNATPPGKILTWMLRELSIDISISAWRKEYSSMVKLYTQALDIAHTPADALQALRDYFDYLDNPSFRAKVTRPASYMMAGFANWYKQIPPKPRDTREQEEITGYRFRYNLNNKNWERANAKKT